MIGEKMIELKSKDFNAEQYILVDEYDDIIENEIVYHFSTENNDLFCIKVNDEYKEIKDEKTIELIKKMYDLFPPEVIFNKRESIDEALLAKILFGANTSNKLSDEKREIFFEIQIEQLKKLDIDIDFSKLKDRLMNNGNVYMCEELRGDGSGFFHPATNSIFVSESDSYENSTFLHETIHKASGPVAVITQPCFFIEGGTTSIVDKLCKTGDFSEISSLKDTQQNSRSIRYNFDLGDVSYQNYVCLLRQIEHAVGYSADKDILNGTRKILDDFSRQYGRDVLIYTKHIAKQINIKPWRKGSYEKMVKAQNLILERVFNKEFPKELSMESAQEYLKKLQGMELQRARIDGDEYYKEFYEQKYTIIKQQLLKKGYDLSEIEEKIPPYEPAKFNPTRLEKMINESPVSYLAEKFANPREIARYCINNRFSSIEKDDLKTYVMRKDGLFLEFFTYKGMIWKGNTIKDSKKIYVEAQRNTSDEKTEETSVYYDSKNDRLKFDGNGQTYEFEEVDVSEELIERINTEIQRMEELRQNAMQQRASEVQNAKRNLIQKIKEWINIKKNNKVQEGPKKDENDQR